MKMPARLALALLLAALLPACSTALTSAASAPVPAAVAPAATPAPSGERLAYVVGCVNCHHQTPKEIFNAPPLTVVKAYSLPEFEALLRTGKARGGRDLYAQGSIMGIVAREQLSHLTEAEIEAIHRFLQDEWTLERAAVEEAKIATFPRLNLKP